MILIIEIDKPFLKKPFHFKSRVMDRYGWGFFAISFLHITMRELAETQFKWLHQ